MLHKLFNEYTGLISPQDMWLNRYISIRIARNLIQIDPFFNLLFMEILY